MRKMTVKQKRRLCPCEIRVIKIDREAILNLTWRILGKICFEKFRLPHGIRGTKRICIDWCFDAEKCEITLLAHSSIVKLNMGAAAYINDHPVEAVESLYLNPGGKDIYFSIPDPAFEISQPDAHMDAFRNRLGCALEKLHAMLDHRIRPLEEHEIRVIRLSQEAIRELIWEYFMKNGDEIMDIPEKDRFSIIFHMFAEENLKELTLYAINRNEASDAVFEEADAYCRKNICVTADSLLEKSGRERCYVSVTLPKP